VRDAAVLGEAGDLADPDFVLDLLDLPLDFEGEAEDEADLPRAITTILVSKPKHEIPYLSY
jgi:hypothetical protein